MYVEEWRELRDMERFLAVCMRVLVRLGMCVCVYIRIYVRIYVVAILTGSESGEMGCRRDGRAGDNDIHC